MFGRDVLSFNNTWLGFVNMQMQTNWIFHPADETMT
jgi:hypothetical protein